MKIKDFEPNELNFTPPKGHYNGSMCYGFLFLVMGLIFTFGGITTMNFSRVFDYYQGSDFLTIVIGIIILASTFTSVGIYLLIRVVRKLELKLSDQNISYQTSFRNRVIPLQEVNSIILHYVSGSLGGNWGYLPEHKKVLNYFKIIIFNIKKPVRISVDIFSEDIISLIQKQLLEYSKKYGFNIEKEHNHIVINWD